jgi:SagB-type dehydrogenase family enzyme
MNQTETSSRYLPQGSTELWSLREDVLMESDAADDSVVLCGRWGSLVVRNPGEPVRKLLYRMQLGPVSLDNVLAGADGTERAGIAARRARLLVALERLQPLIVRSVAARGTEHPLMSMVPIARWARFQTQAVALDLPVRLSAYAALRSDGADTVVESPLSLHRVVLHRVEAAWIVATLARPCTPREAARILPLPGGLVQDVIAYLVAAGIVVQGDVEPEAGRTVFAEDEDPALRGWTAVDLAFHAHSTQGRHDGDFGATYPFGAGSGPEPVVKQWPPNAVRHRLHQPRLAEVIAADPPFTAVLESRRSSRTFGSDGFTARELGELLFRTARTRATRERSDGDAHHAPLADRPYPGGGALHELEFYLAVHDCPGIERGVYAYDSAAHELVEVCMSPDAVDSLAAQARYAAGLDGPPPVLILMTARFRRISWKYTGLSYALILKDVGVAMQTLYLVGTAMGLATCAIGGSEIDESSRILGLDWLVESSVGLFMVGAPAADRLTGGESRPRDRLDVPDGPTPEIQTYTRRYEK